MNIKLQIFSVLIIAFSFSCNRNNPEPKITDSNQLVETIEYKTIEGVDENLLSLDIYYTDDTSDMKPIVFWVHGGGWSIGDKANNITDKATLFQSNNWLFISINYRLSPFPYEVSNPDRVKYPDHNNDVADAIKWVYENIDSYGGDKNEIVLLGHSAGAHLVSLIGTNSTFIEDRDIPFSIIKGVASIDTEGYDVDKIANTGSSLYINAFGTIVSDYIEASPIHNLVSGTSYPKFFVGKRGETERIAVADEFISALEDQQVSVSQIDGSIYTHAEINEAIGLEDETLITDPLIEFITDCFNQ